MIGFNRPCADGSDTSANPLRMEELVYNASHSLIEQSRAPASRRISRTPTASGSAGTGRATRRASTAASRRRGATATCRTSARRSSPRFFSRTSAPQPAPPVQQTNCHPVPLRPLDLRPQRLHRRLRASPARPAARGRPGLFDADRGHDRLRAPVLPRAHVRARRRAAAGARAHGGLRRGDGPPPRRRRPVADDARLSDGERLYAVRYASGDVANSLYVSNDAPRRPPAVPRGRASRAPLGRGARGGLRAARRSSGHVARGAAVIGADRPARRRRATRLRPAAGYTLRSRPRRSRTGAEVVGAG